MEARKARRPNKLIHEKSPYLLQHAYNPVEWYPWGEEALRRAKDEDKPIFLSIGYSSCHWCHVQTRESFENEEIARIMNKNFICIKVDREERPDIDELYMRAVQSMTGRGGWPLSVFLTPDLKPFYGGTYFPPEGQGGLPGFKDVLLAVAKMWREQRERVEAFGQLIFEALKKSYEAKAEDVEVNTMPLDALYEQLVLGFDQEYGGFGRAPKFPMPSYIFFLLRYHYWKRQPAALTMAIKTLKAMAFGGIYDQLGGGFHRYSTDRWWLIPHFEKMLYDNALLAKAYLEAYQVTRDDLLKRIAGETLDWALREMRNEKGAFYSSIDSDSGGSEGAFYVWSPAEINAVLGEKQGELLSRHFGVTTTGNFENGKSVLHVARNARALAAELGMGAEEVEGAIRDGKVKLYEHRLSRARPLVDDKVLTSWNGLMISALAAAYEILGVERYLEAALEAATFILQNLIKNGRLMRRYREGDAAIAGTLEDYAYFSAGLLDLYEASFDARWLKEALRLTREMIDLFEDEDGGFLLKAKGEGDLPVKLKDAYDGATPSGNSVATLNLLRLARLTGYEDLHKAAMRAIRAFWGSMQHAPADHSYMLTALHFMMGPKEIVVVGDPNDMKTQALIREIRRHFLPNKVLALSQPGRIPPKELEFLFSGKLPVNGQPAVYICENYACKRPITDPESLRKSLSSEAG